MGFSFVMQAQDLQRIKLAAPNKKGGLTVMEAFDNRKSVRTFATTKFRFPDLCGNQDVTILN
jgi:hypothetical protein